MHTMQNCSRTGGACTCPPSISNNDVYTHHANELQVSDVTPEFLYSRPYSCSAKGLAQKHLQKTERTLLSRRDCPMCEEPMPH